MLVFCLAYAQSRTANVLFAVGATVRWATDGITANALNPGATSNSAARSAGGRPAAPGRPHKTPRQAAATAVLLATSHLLEGIGGRYFNDCNEADPVDHRPSGTPAISKSVARYALDTANADRLWETSIRLLA